MIVPDLVLDMADMAGIPEALVGLLLSTLELGMTKQVDEGWRGGKREMRLEREENAKLYHWLLVDTWSHTCRTVAAQMSSRTVLSWRGRRSPYI